VVGAASGGTPARATDAPGGGVDAVAVSPATGRVLVGLNGKAGRCLWWSDDHGVHWQVARGLGNAPW